MEIQAQRYIPFKLDRPRRADPYIHLSTRMPRKVSFGNDDNVRIGSDSRTLREKGEKSDVSNGEILSLRGSLTIKNSGQYLHIEIAYRRWAASPRITNSS